MRLRPGRLALTLAVSLVAGEVLARVGIKQGMHPLVVFALLFLLGMAWGALTLTWVWED